MKAQVDPEIQRIRNEIDENHLKLEETLSDLKERFREGVAFLNRDPSLTKKAFLLAGAMVVLGLVLFYDRGSKK